MQTSSDTPENKALAYLSNVITGHATSMCPIELNECNILELNVFLELLLHSFLYVPTHKHGLMVQWYPWRIQNSDFNSTDTT